MCHVRPLFSACVLAVLRTVEEMLVASDLPVWTCEAAAAGLTSQELLLVGGLMLCIGSHILRRGCWLGTSGDLDTIPASQIEPTFPFQHAASPEGWRCRRVPKFAARVLGPQRDLLQRSSSGKPVVTAARPIPPRPASPLSWSRNASIKVTRCSKQAVRSAEFCGSASDSRRHASPPGARDLR